jgi:hypothetical protein
MNNKNLVIVIYFNFFYILLKIIEDELGEDPNFNLAEYLKVRDQL